MLQGRQQADRGRLAAAKSVFRLRPPRSVPRRRRRGVDLVQEEHGRLPYPSRTSTPEPRHREDSCTTFHVKREQGAGRKRERGPIRGRSLPLSKAPRDGPTAQGTDPPFSARVHENRGTDQPRREAFRREPTRTKKTPSASANQRQGGHCRDRPRGASRVETQPPGSRRPLDVRTRTRKPPADSRGGPPFNRCTTFHVKHEQGDNHPALTTAQPLRSPRFGAGPHPPPPFIETSSAGAVLRACLQPPVATGCVKLRPDSRARLGIQAVSPRNATSHRRASKPPPSLRRKPSFKDAGFQGRRL